MEALLLEGRAAFSGFSSVWYLSTHHQQQICEEEVMELCKISFNGYSRIYLVEAWRVLVMTLLCFAFLLQLSCVIPTSGFLHSFLSSPVRFRFYQKYSDVQWAIDNFYLGPGCLENCRGHGDCLNEQCICDPGYSGPNCYLTQTLKVTTACFKERTLPRVWLRKGKDQSNWKFSFGSCQPEGAQTHFQSLCQVLNKTATAVCKNKFVPLQITLPRKL